MREALSAFRIQAAAGPVTDQVLEEILFRSARDIGNSLVAYPGPQRVALLPSVIRLMLAAFLEEVGTGRS